MFVSMMVADTGNESAFRFDKSEDGTWPYELSIKGGGIDRVTFHLTENDMRKLLLTVTNKLSTVLLEDVFFDVQSELQERDREQIEKAV